MSINDISSCLKGGRSCGVGREEHASNLLWCEHCGIALCFDCDTDLHNSKNLKHGHLRVLLPTSRTEAVRKCEHGADGSSNVHFGLITKNSPPKYTKGRASKKGKGASNSESGRRSSSSRIDGGDVGVGIPVTVSDTSDLAISEKALSISLKLPRSALRGSYENAGLGSRPKQHVTWHPDVKEPLCSIISHTVGHKRAPAFLSRRSHQKQLRQKSKASSKSQARSKKQESNKHKNSDPVNVRPDVTSGLVEDPALELGSIDFAAPPTNQDLTNPTGRNCSYCIQENRLCGCVSMTDGYLSDPSLQTVLLESAVHPVSLVNEIIKDVPAVNAVDKKVPAFSTDDECLKESFSEEYRQLLASVVHAATSLGKNETLRSRANCEAASGLFRDVKMHAPGTALSGSEQVFKQSTQGKISPWISVV